MPTLVTTPVVFNRWTEIDSWFEGNFLERIAPGATKKTVRENRDAIKVLFQHGHDPQIGDKPLGKPSALRESADGLDAEVPLLDTAYNRELVPGLEAGLYGASFRFRVVREEINDEPGVSEYNPKGIPERTIKELRLYEFGPVTFPAYADATAGVRSLTDNFLLERLSIDEAARLRDLLDARASGRQPSGIIVPSRDVAEDTSAVEAEHDEAAPPDSQSAPPEMEPAAEATPDEGSRAEVEDVATTKDEATEEERAAPDFWFAGVTTDEPNGSPTMPRRQGLFLLTRRD